MKTSLIAMLLFSMVATISAQNLALGTGNTNQSPTMIQGPKDTPYAVSFRDGNTRVWERTTYEKSPSGQWIPHLHRFTELATGLHHQDPQTGDWVESKEEIDILPDGTAAATNGQHSVHFPASIYLGVIELITPDGEHLKSRPLGISYYDGTNSVLIAELTNSVGQLISSNQIIYTNAFTDFAADLVMTYRKSGFEADLVIRSQPPFPEVFGLSSKHCRMELLTEFFDSPDPQQTPANSVADLADSTLQFGGMTMSRGKAFEIGNPQTAVPVSKSWEWMDGRTFLIEAVPVPLISPELQALPVSATGGASIVSADSVLHKVSASRLLPLVRTAQSVTNTIRFAKAESYRVPGVVWDYNIVNSQSNFTFRGDTTYYVSNSVNLSGTTIIEAGSVIKYDTNYNCSVNILGTVHCKTGPYRPAIFTCVNDATVGESINSPFPFCDAELNLELVNDLSEDLTAYVFDDSENYYVNGDVVPASHGSSGPYTLPVSSGQDLEFNGYDTDNNAYSLSFQPTLQNGILEIFDNGVPSYSDSGDSLCLPPPTVSSTALSLANGGMLNDLIIRYVGVGIQSSSNYYVTNLQIVQCPTAFQTENASLYAGNVLISGFSGSSIAFGGHSFNVQAEQLTDDQGGEVAWSSSGSSSLALTNALITDVSSFGNTTLHTNFVVKVSGGSSVYRVAGAGSHYLATNSTYRAFGTTNISTSLLAQLRQKTTYPPVVYSNITILTNMEFGPHAPRDTNALLVDLGYHYDSLDWCFGGVTANSNLTFDAGTAVGWFETTYPYGCGIALSNHVTNTFNGTVTAPCIFAHYSTVQEGGNGNWTLKGVLGGISTVGNTNYFAEIDAKFMDSYALAADPNHFRDYQAQLNVRANHCEFYCGSMVGFWLGQFMTNCLYDRLSQCGEQYKSAGVFWRNCLMHGGQVFILHSLDHNWPVWIENCTFDGTTTNVNMDDYSGGDTNKTYCNFNAFLNGAKRLMMHGSNDLVLTNTFTWQNGPLGTFYQATNSPLTNTGSISASLVGLYHFTVQTNEVPEGTNIVSIGYHYVALDTNGLPIDTDGDGVADYIEDSNGDGVYDAGDLGDWLLGIDVPPQSQNIAQGQNASFTVVAGGLTPFSYQWMFNGTNISGANNSTFTLLVATTNNEGGYSVIVSNSTGSVTSSPAILDVSTPLSITSEPTNATVVQGGSTNFSVGVTGNHPVYQWYGSGGPLVNGSGFGGATTSNLTISAITGSDAGNYDVVVANAFNSVSSTLATLTVITNPGVRTRPGNHTNIQADDVTLSVGASGFGLCYQWWLTNSLGTNAIPGATNSTYLKLVVQTNDAGNYAVVITNLAGSTNVSGSLTVLVPPWFTNQPVSVTNNAGTSATFTAAALGTTNLYYQWFKNGTNPLAGQTNTSLTLANVQTSDAGGYSLMVSNITGTNMSAWAWLSIVSASPTTTNYGWGGGSSPVLVAPSITMTLPTNTVATNPAIYLSGSIFSIHAAATSSNDYVTNVSFYTGTNISTCTNLLGAATRGANTNFAFAWTNAVHGTNLLRAVATDNIGLVSTSAVVYVIMDDPPAVFTGGDHTLFWPTGTVSTNVDLAGVVTDDGLPYGITNSSWTNLDGHGFGTATFSNALATNTIATFTNYGTYTLQLSASDGFVTVPASCNVILHPPPVISVTLPTNNSAFANGTPLLLNAVAYGLNSTVTSVQFFIGTNLIGQAIQSLSNNYDFLWTSAPAVCNGSLTAMATDNYGINTTSAPVQITVDTGPTAQMVSPSNQVLNARSSNTVQAIATAFCSSVPIQYVEFLEGPPNGVTNIIGAALAPTGGFYQISWTPPVSGNCVIIAKAVDSLNLSGTSPPITNYVRAVPSVEITFPTNGQIFPDSPTNLVISATATADGATITNVTFYQGTNFIGAANSGNPYTITTNGAIDGTYTLNAKAFDSTGLVGISSNIMIIVEPTNQAPRVYPGTNLIVYLSTNWVPLHGMVSDDGLPVGSTLTVNWTNLNGGTNVTFMNSNLPAASVYFWATGTYVLQLSASDFTGDTVSSNITVTVYPSNQPPQIIFGWTNGTNILPAAPSSNSVGTVDLTALVYDIDSLYGIDYFSPSNCLIASVQSVAGSPNFALVYPDRSVSTFSTVSNLNTSGELHIATARSTLGGFKPGEIFCATGTDSQGQDSKIMRIEPDGTTIGTNRWTDSTGKTQSNSWVVLTQTNQYGSTNLQLFSGLWVDRTGVWGGDLIAVGYVHADGTAYVWRITSSGKATLVATLPAGNTYDSVTTIPNDVQKYGPWAGRILTGGDYRNGPIFAIDTNGIVSTFYLGVGTESILVIPNSENFFGWDGGDTLYTAPSSDFEAMSGDILTADECPFCGPGDPPSSGGYLYRLHWDGTNFNIYPLIDSKIPWEPVAFCPGGLSGVPPSGVQLTGVVTDDGEILSTPSNHWRVVSGPGPVQFADAGLTNTLAEFAVPGQYTLQLSAFDGQYTSSSNVTVQVLQNYPPYVSAGPDQTITTTNTTLQGIVTDDGLPYHVTNSQWSVAGGNVSYVHFGSFSSTNSTVRFDSPGTYTLMLRGDDGQATNFSQVTINVQGPSMTVTPTNLQVNCTNTVVAISATVLDVSGSPLGGNYVDFSIISGPDNSPTPLRALTGSDGIASVTYTNTTGFSGEDIVQVGVEGDSTLTNYVVEDWGLGLGCGDSYTGKAVGQEGGYTTGNHSIEFPRHIADYYFITAQSNQTVNLLLTQVTGPLVMLLRDLTTQQVVAESPVQFVQVNDVTSITYTCAHTGQYLLEVAEVFENFSDTYNLQLSCSGGPEMSILYNGNAVPNGGTVAFPQTVQGSPTNVLLTITNSGGAPFKIIGIGTNGDFVLTNNVLGDTISAGDYTNLGVKFNASSNGISWGALALVPDGGAIAEYVVYFMASTFPTSAIPEVQLTFPTNGSTFLDSQNIAYSAVATSGSAAIAKVELAEVTTNGLVSFPTNLIFDLDSSYTNTYPAQDLGGVTHDGDFTVVAIVSDVSGQTNISAPILIHIVPTTTTNVSVLPDLVVIANQSNAPNGGTIVFPTTLPGQSTNITLVISNAGNYPLAISNFSLIGDFSVSSDAANNLVNGTIAAGASTNLLFTFNASAPGTSIGEVNVENNVPSSGVYSTYLMGNAYPPGQGPGSSTNLPPVAVDDEVRVLANSHGNIFTPLTNDYSPNGYPLTIVAATGSEGGTLGIVNNGKAISYTPPRGIRSYPEEPADGFYYEISDGHGGTNWATDYIIIDASDIPAPIITSPPDPYITNAGAVVTITATDTNSPNIVEVDFYLGLDLIGEVTNGTNGQFTFNWTNVYDAAMPTVLITAVAIDKFGQYGTSPPLHITTTPLAGAGQLTAALDNFIDASGTTALNPTNANLVRDGLLTLNGRATNSLGSNVVWQLGVYSADGTLIRNLTPSSTGPVGTANTPALLLSNCDLTTLQNGVYDLRLTVIGGYEIADASVTIRLESNLKIGQFSFSQQDLIIPVNGVPLTVTRTYNSLNPDQGDFGKGWTYALADLDVQFDEERRDVKDIDGNTFSERVGGGRDVTLTLPNGQRTTFYFTLQPVGTLGTYDAIWQAAPGVTATLTPMGDIRLETLEGSLTGDPDLDYWDAVGSETPMDAYDFPGFYLTNLDGTAYVITRDDLGDHFMDAHGKGPFIQAYGDAHLSQIRMRNGAVTTISLNSIVTTSPTGATNQITFQRNTAGLIASISDPIGNASNGPPAMIYQYDSINNLIAVERLVDRSGSGTYVTNSMFTYTNVNFPHYVTGIINADGTPVAENFYDDSGKLTGVQDANGNVTHFIHNPTNDMEVIVDRNNHTNTYVYDLRGNVTAQTNQLGEITTMAYDGNNNKTNQVVYMGNQPYATNNYVYDTNLNLMVVSIDPLGYSNSYAYDEYGEPTNSIDALGHGTTNVYDAQGDLIAATNAVGNTTLNSYGGGLLLGSVDAVGTLTTNAYDRNDNLIGTAVIDSSWNIVSSNSFTYDDNNNQVTSTVWRRVGGIWTNATTTNVYDAMNRVVQIIHPDGGTNTVIYDLDGRQQATTDALGRITSYTYDSQGRLTATTNADGTIEQSIYDGNGNRVGSVNQLGYQTTYVYDVLNRLVQTIYPDKTTNTTTYDDVGRLAKTVDARDAVTAYDYDVAGRRLAVTNAAGTTAPMVSKYSYDADGNQIITTDAANHSTTNVFDALNRQIQVQYADGTTTSSGFDAVGRSAASTNQAGIVTLFGYDGAGRLISVTNALNEPEQMVTQYQYDEAGNEVARIDALGRTNTFAYDGMGRRTLHTRPDSHTESFVYDITGSLVYHTNFDVARIIFNQYDSMNRLTNRTQLGLLSDSFTYTATGQRATMYCSDSSFDCTYEYDNRDRLTRKTSMWSGINGGGPLTVSLGYGYDCNGNLTNLASSMANGVNLSYAYDALNRITNVLSHGQLTASYAFDAVGNLQTLKYANGVTNQYQYDALNRLTNLVWTTNGNMAAKFYYQLGKTGNRTNLSEIVNQTSRTNSWQYDNLYRLTQEIINDSAGSNYLQYQYDAVGNRMDRASSIPAILPPASYGYDNNDWLTTDGYDGNPTNNISQPGDGNTTLSGTSSYSYDWLNRMTIGNGIAFVYDGDGNRIAKTAQAVGGPVIYYLVDDRNPTAYPQVLEEYVTVSQNGVSAVLLNRSYNYGLSLISQQQYDTNTLLPSALSYYGFDGHGSVRFLTDSNGNITDNYTYDAYGTVITSGGNIPNNYLYTGQQFDPDIGLYYLRARYYKPDTGRFWTKDGEAFGKKNDPLSLHRYLYCADDPSDKDDLSGNDAGSVASVISDFASLASGRLPADTVLPTLSPIARSGTDLTDRLKTTLDMIESQFGVISSDTKKKMCRRIIGEDPVLGMDGAKDAWYMSEMAWPTISKLAGRTYTPPLSATFDYGAGECWPSIAINGKCYYTYAVNYIMFGKIMHLAKQYMTQFGEGDKYTMFQALQDVIAYNEVYRHEPLNGFNMQEKLGLTMYGYSELHMDPSGFAIPHAYVDPKNVSKNQYAPFEYVWLPGLTAARYPNPFVN